MGKRDKPSGSSWALVDDSAAPGQTNAATPSDGARAVGSSRAAGSDPLVGTLLAGKYRILEVVGEGGMGRVYRAEHAVAGAAVAVKVLSGRFGSTPQKAILDRFFREIRTTAALNHPGIVRLYDAGEENGMAYLVMEFLAGEDLDHLLKREGPLSPKRAVAIMLQLCDALEAAHEARDRSGSPLGIVHRDLKPENIFLLPGSVGAEIVKVVDFGIAKVRLERGGNLTLDGHAVGTPEFMSPEQARGEVADRRSDVYAAGVLLYLMLTGHLPHEEAVGTGATPVKILHVKCVNTPPTPITQYRNDLPSELADVVMWALQNDAGLRPQTMADFAKELRAAMEATPVVRRSTRVWVAPQRKPTPIRSGELQSGKPFPIYWVGVAGVAVLAGILGVMIARLGNKPTREAVTATAPAVVKPARPASRSAATPSGFGAPADSAGKPAPISAEPKPPSAKPAETERGRRAARQHRAESNGERFVKLGRDYLQLGRMREAEKAFEGAITTREMRVRGRAYAGLAETAFKQGRFPEAVQHARAALAAGGHSSAQLTLANAYLQLGKYAEAAAQYEKILERDPNNMGAHRNLDRARAYLPRQ